MASGSADKKDRDLDVATFKDNYTPLFDGFASSYKEWRKSITIYHHKMVLAKRRGEAVLNLLGSLMGPAWRIVEAEDPDSRTWRSLTRRSSMSRRWRCHSLTLLAAVQVKHSSSSLHSWTKR